MRRLRRLRREERERKRTYGAETIMVCADPLLGQYFAHQRADIEEGKDVENDEEEANADNK